MDCFSLVFLLSFPIYSILCVSVDLGGKLQHTVAVTGINKAELN